jgi:hypothetical protein
MGGRRSSAAARLSKGVVRLTALKSGVNHVKLSRAEQPIACVSKSGQDITLLVQFAIKGSAIDDDLRMGLCESSYSGRRRHEAEKANSCRASALQ